LQKQIRHHAAAPGCLQWLHAHVRETAYSRRTHCCHQLPRCHADAYGCRRCGSVLQCVAVCVAVCYHRLSLGAHVPTGNCLDVTPLHMAISGGCSVLQRVAVCCSVCCSVCLDVAPLHMAVSCGCSVLQCVAVCCSVLQCAAVCCSVLHCMLL